MRMILPVVVCLLWSLVEVQSQTEYPYISFMGNTLPNHSYVDLSQVGSNYTGSGNNTVQCHTDLVACCRSQPNGVPGRGDWFAPGNKTRLPFHNENGQPDIHEDRQNMVVHIRRTNNANGPSGIYRCVIPTNATHNVSDPSVGEAVYVGLYAREKGFEKN